MTVGCLKATFGVAAVSVMLSSCGAAQDIDSCAPLGESYLQDADFELERLDGKSLHWRSKQHAGEPSFETDISNGVLTIRKIGTQPWLLYWQRLQSDEFAGKRLAFSAEMKLDEASTDSQRVQPPARLSLKALSKDKKELRRFYLDFSPKPGMTDWQPIQMVVNLPPRATIVVLGFLVQADGALLIRNPSFSEVDRSSVACKRMLTPRYVRPSQGGPSGLG